MTCRFDPGSGYESGVSVSTEAPFSLKNGSLPIRIAIIGLNSAVRKLFCIFENNISAQNVSITYNITNTIDYHEFL